MKPQKNFTQKAPSKGDRLNWTPLRDVKPVVLNKELTKGRRLDNVISNNSHPANFLVP